MWSSSAAARAARRSPTARPGRQVGPGDRKGSAACGRTTRFPASAATFGATRFIRPAPRRSCAFLASRTAACPTTAVTSSLTSTMSPMSIAEMRRPDYATIEGYTAQLVGGGTQLYGGVSLRFTPTDLQLKTFNENRRSPIKDDPSEDVRREARDWPINYATLEPYYARAEEMIGINGTAPNQQKPFTSGDKYQKPLRPIRSAPSHVTACWNWAAARREHRALSRAACRDHRGSSRRAAVKFRGTSAASPTRKPPRRATSIDTAIRSA